MNLLGGVHQRGPGAGAIIGEALADAARRVSPDVGEWRPQRLCEEWAGLGDGTIKILDIRRPLN
jgi:hypothetical protein